MILLAILGERLPLVEIPANNKFGGQKQILVEIYS